MNKLHMGTMGWSYPFWAENFYSKGVSSNNYLTYYSKHFDTVEIDSTFYRIPSKTTFQNWKEQTPDDFLFSAKFPQSITHKKMLINCNGEVDFFMERTSTLQNKLGPLLLQFPRTFGPKKIPRLEEFLSKLPREHRYAVEVRNREMLTDALYSVLRKNRVALVLTVGSIMPETEQMNADFVYIRWEGDRSKVNGTLGKVEIDRTDEIRVWADKINKLREKVEVFGYFSKYYSGHPPTDAKRLLELAEHVS
ncbi:MAG TPA: DUF72 domain-containing protein [Candidatus Bathyarchaeia archaeon]|nr:DUF72 domain-containing protein [Candidatus Bathyarchaeia archaeon]